MSAESRKHENERLAIISIAIVMLALFGSCAVLDAVKSRNNTQKEIALYQALSKCRGQ